MGITVTLTDLDNLTNQTSAVAAINSNSAAIVAGFEDALNVSGDTMLGDLDMNSKQIYNLPTPSSTSSPLRLLDVQLLNGDGTIEAYPLPAGGTSGQVLTKVDSTNYNVEWSPPPQLAASALSNGTTGTGAVVLETAPTITGSVTGNPIFTQNVGFGKDTNPQAPVYS